MENGDADGYHLSFLAAAGAAPEDDYGDRAFADGQWRCRLEQLRFLLRDQLLVYILCLLVWLQQWRMEIRLPPASWLGRCTSSWLLLL